jgi:hypothetical protein
MNNIFIDITPQYVTSLQISVTDTSKRISATITGFEAYYPNELAWAISPASYTIIQGIFFTQLAPTSTENSITIYYAVAQNVLLADIRFYLRENTSSSNTWDLIIPEVKTTSSATFNNLMSGTDYSGLLGWSINNGPKEVIPGVLITDAVATSTTEPSSTVNSSSTTTATDSSTTVNDSSTTTNDSSTTTNDSSTTTNNSSTTTNDSSTTTNDSSTTNNLSPESIAFLRSTSESITFNYVVAFSSEVTFAVSGESPSVTSITISETQTIKTISATLSGLPANKSQSGFINWKIDNGSPSVIEGNFGTQQAPTTIANSITIYYAVAQNVSTANIYFYLRENTSSNNWGRIWPVVTTSSATFNLQSETDYSGLLGWRIKIGSTTVGPIEVIPGSLITDAAATSSTTESSTTANFIPANFFVPHNFFIPHIAPDPILSLWHAWGVCREEDLRDPNIPSTIYFLVTKLVVSGNGYQIITANCLLKQYKIFPPESPPLDLSQIDLGQELDSMERLVFETTLANQTTIYPICWTIFASKDANDLILAKDSLGNNYPSPLIGVQPPAPFVGDPVLVNCLLKGTKVKTPYGFSLIENIKEGDIVLNQHGYLTKVIKTISWGIKWADIDKDESNKVYKIAAGKHGCNETVYISHWHQILINSRLICAKDAGLPLATEAEVGSEFTYYHICLEDYERNHLVVNGNCVVESWSGQTPKRIPKLQIPIITSVKKTAILKHFTPKFLTSAKKIF